MKTICTKITLFFAAALLQVSCGTQMKGSANDTTGTNGATNGTGKVVKSDAVHNVRN